MTYNKELCKHENTIVTGDEDGYKVFCIDCELQEEESEYTDRKEAIL